MSNLRQIWEKLNTPKPKWEEFEKITGHSLVEYETIVAAWRDQKRKENFKYNIKNE